MKIFASCASAGFLGGYVVSESCFGYSDPISTFLSQMTIIGSTLSGAAIGIGGYMIASLREVEERDQVANVCVGILCGAFSVNYIFKKN